MTMMRVHFGQCRRLYFDLASRLQVANGAALLSLCILGGGLFSM
ncbi:MAG: hypothetical protein QOC89_524 [Paraburkholderia sp.]|nr:hypothetical protein [Paraburkholderia sp.]